MLWITIRRLVNMAILRVHMSLFSPEESRIFVSKQRHGMKYRTAA